ncbi:MAG: nucleoside deaminase [Cyclobacteriaceae bacterium]
MFSALSDEHYMLEAIKEAEKAKEIGEVPVGAIVVCDFQIVARAHNQVEQLTDATAHAEILAITSASNYIGSKFLEECTLYVTLEPCAMCGGALFWSRIGKMVYGASDEKRGYASLNKNILHPSTEVVSGVHENECSQLVSSFFQDLRNK